MIYTTRIYGTPYGNDGERGNDTTAPLKLAITTLQPGQLLDCFRASDEGQTTPIKRFARSAEHGVTEVIL